MPEGFTPTFLAAGTGHRGGAVPDPGQDTPPYYVLRADATWGTGGMVPLPPGPTGPALDVLACKIAGYLVQEVVRQCFQVALNQITGVGGIQGIIFQVLDLLPFSSDIIPWAVDSTVGLIERIVAGGLISEVEAWLEDRLWNLIGCYVYSIVDPAVGWTQATWDELINFVLAIPVVPSAVLELVADFLRDLGVDAANALAALASNANYDCSACAGGYTGATGLATGPVATSLPLNYEAGLSVADGTGFILKVGELDFVGATVTALTGASGGTWGNIAQISGLQGATGAAGATGAVGATGPAGPAGATGPSVILSFPSTAGVGTAFDAGVGGTLPIGWQDTAYDDSGWSAPIAETEGVLFPAIAGSAWITYAASPLDAANDVWGHRRHFSIPGSVGQRAVLAIGGDNSIDAIYVNGTSVGLPPGVPNPAWSLEIGAYIVAGDNVLAVQVRNGGTSGPGNPTSLDYVVVVEPAGAPGPTGPAGPTGATAPAGFLGSAWPAGATGALTAHAWTTLATVTPAAGDYEVSGQANIISSEGSGEAVTVALFAGATAQAAGEGVVPAAGALVVGIDPYTVTVDGATAITLQAKTDGSGLTWERDAVAGGRITYLSVISGAGPTGPAGPTGAAGGGPLAPFTPPVPGDFAWYNQTTAGGVTSVLTTRTGSLTMRQPANATDAFSLQRKALPATPYTITAFLVQGMAAVSFAQAGLVLQNSTPTTGIFFYSDPQQQYIALGHGDAVRVTAIDSNLFTQEPWRWLRIRDDGTTRTFSVSNTGYDEDFVQIFSQAHGTPFAPDHIAWGVDARNASYDCLATLFSWAETSP